MTFGWNDYLVILGDGSLRTSDIWLPIIMAVVVSHPGHFMSFQRITLNYIFMMNAAILLFCEAKNESLVFLSKPGHRGNDKKCQTMNHTDTIGCHPLIDVMASKEEHMCLLHFCPGSGQMTMGGARQRQGHNRRKGSLQTFSRITNFDVYYITIVIYGSQKIPYNFFLIEA